MQKEQMQLLPRTITNPLVGDSVTFLETASETGGKYTLVEVTLKPGGGTGLHYHIDYAEEFTAVEGTLGIQLGKQTLHLLPGEQAIAPIRSKHRFFNPGNTSIRFLVKITPARYFEQMLRIAYGLATDGLCNAKGVPLSIWHTAILFEVGETYMPGIPLGIQRTVFGWLARIARRKGKDKELEKYYKGVVASKVSKSEMQAA